MSEIRQDQVTKRWVIMATERAKRPREMVDNKLSGSSQPEYSPTCPFCPGNEQMTPPELFAIRESGGLADSSGWQVRVLPNRFAALLPEGEVRITTPYWFKTVTGTGSHEVIRLPVQPL